MYVSLGSRTIDGGYAIFFNLSVCFSIHSDSAAGQSHCLKLISRSHLILSGGALGAMIGVINMFINKSISNNDHSFSHLYAFLMVICDSTCLISLLNLH